MHNDCKLPIKCTEEEEEEEELSPAYLLLAEHVRESSRFCEREREREERERERERERE